MHPHETPNPSWKRYFGHFDALLCRREPVHAYEVSRVARSVMLAGFCWRKVIHADQKTSTRFFHDDVSSDCSLFSFTPQFPAAMRDFFHHCSLRACLAARHASRCYRATSQAFQLWPFASTKYLQRPHEIQNSSWFEMLFQPHGWLLLPLRTTLVIRHDRSNQDCRHR
jgi:hypothetical protein